MLKSEGQLLVGSVYSESTNNNLWYKLQKNFIEKNTDNFKFVIYANGADLSLFDQDDVIKYYPQKQKFGHRDGLNFIVQYAQQNNFKNLLILDSDCFPIMENWQKNLEKEMKSFSVASVVRTEFLDTFAHPCACYIKNVYKNNIKFCYKQKINLIGVEYCDIELNVQNFFPLLRSNLVNIDPKFFAIYKGFFYHHGAGSRNIFQASNDRTRGYFSTPIDYQEKNDYVIKMLDTDPYEFIKYLNENNVKY